MTRRWWEQPLPAKLLANLIIKPLASALEKVISEGADDANDLVEQAVRALQRDPDVAAALCMSADAIEAGPIFSSMGESSSINGRVSKSLQLQFQLGGAVAAARGQGDEEGRMKLIDVRVQAGGRTITATAAGGGGGSGGISEGSRGGASGGFDATIIDVEARD